MLSALPPASAPQAVTVAAVERRVGGSEAQPTPSEERGDFPLPRPSPVPEAHTVPGVRAATGGRRITGHGAERVVGGEVAAEDRGEASRSGGGRGGPAAPLSGQPAAKR